MFRLAFTLMFASFSLFCQNPIVLVNADSVVGYRINEAPVRDFFGNVHLRQGNVDLFCNKATHFLEENRAILSGSVKLVQDTLVLISEYIEYDGNKSIANSPSQIEIKDPQNYLKANYGVYNFRTRIANFFNNVVYEEKQAKLLGNIVDYDRSTQNVNAYGNVKLQTDSLILNCDTLSYSKSEGMLFATSKVLARGKYEAVEISSGKLFWDRKNRITKSYDNPRLIQIDTIQIINEDIAETKFDTLFIFADTLVSKSEENVNIMTLINNVRLFKDELVAIGKFGMFERENEIGFLVGSPMLWFDSTEFRGDSLFFLMKDKKITLVEFLRNAVILSPSGIDTFYINKINSDTVKIVFNDSKIDFILGLGNSRTSYFLENEETNEINLANYFSDSVIIYFKNNKVDNIVWLKNVNGEVIPKIIFEKNFDKFYNIPNEYLLNKPKIY